MIRVNKNRKGNLHEKVPCSSVVRALVLCAGVGLAQAAPAAQQADVVIVGAGAAGMTAAISAYETGARNILLVEKLSVVGGGVGQPTVYGLYINSATRYVDWLIDNVKAAAESWKSGPYYANLQTVGINRTLGGLVIDTTGRVYNGDNLPIFGLYACSGATFSCEGGREAVKNALDK